MQRSSIRLWPARAGHSPGIENSYSYPDTFEARPESGINADATVPVFASAQPEIALAGISIGDWDDLLSAVKDRLRSIVSTQLATPSIQDTDQVRNAVLQCVAALDHLQASIGIAICPPDGSSADALLKSADQAMYAAKRQHTGYAFVSRDGADNPAAQQTPPAGFPPLPQP